jgi:ankyrin repeat protein
MDSLSDAETIESLQGRLNELSSTIDDQYDSIINRMLNGSPESAGLAKCILMFATFSSRPLTSNELRHALAVRTGDSEPVKARIPLEHRLIEVCAGLVVLEKGTDNIKLAHETTMAYLSEKLSGRNLQLSFSPQDGHGKILETCLTYLNFDEFAKGHSLTKETFTDRLEAFPFAPYAVRNWHVHIQPDIDGIERVNKALIMRFLRSPEKIASAEQIKYCHNYHYTEAFPRGRTGLHMVASLGMPFLKLYLERGGKVVDDLDIDTRTPISYAAELGHETVVQLLIETGPDFEIRDIRDKRPLSHAAENGHGGTVELLLNSGAIIEAKDWHGQTALSIAARKGREAVVQLLLEKGAKPESRDYEGCTPLSSAAIVGSTGIAALLLEHGADIEHKDWRGRTPLWLAVSAGSEPLVNLLLEHCADMNTMDLEGHPPLHQAIHKRHADIAGLLIEKGADVNAKDNKGRSLLWWAIFYNEDLRSKLQNIGILQYENQV